MSRLAELIQQHCPDGVEYKQLDEVCYATSNIKWKNTSEYYEYIDLTSVDIDTHAIVATTKINSDTAPSRAQQIVKQGDVIFATTRPTQMRVCLIPPKYDGEICSTGYCVLRPDNTKVLSSFLFYILSIEDFKQYLEQKQTMGNYPAISNKLLKEYVIPVPPLPVQEEIVRILDNFAELQAELHAELQKRLQQYNYYRDKLLTFNDLNRGGAVSVEWKKLGEICSKVCSGGTPSRGNGDYFTGDIPWLRTQEVDWKDIYDTEIKITEDAVKNSSAKLIPENCVIIAMYGATAGKVGINKIPLTTNQACCNLQINPQKALYKYVYYWVCNEYERLKSLGQGSQNNINAQIIKDYPIPIPSLAEQQRIVDILDRFDALTTDITAGLPVEIEARRKQYEYYRDQLLTFKQKA